MAESIIKKQKRLAKKLRKLRSLQKELESENARLFGAAFDAGVEAARARDDLSRVWKLLGDAMVNFESLHRSYPTTAACWGGVGGRMITNHCGFGCQNPAHEAERVAFREALGRIRDICVVR